MTRPRTGKERVRAVEAKRPAVPRSVVVTGAATSTPEIDRLIRNAIDEQRRREQGSAP